MKFIKPDRIAEANIQAEFYHQCKLNGIECYLEYKHEHSRFDAVIIQNDEIEFIIEFKSYKTDKAAKLNTKQLDKYRKYGVQIFVITRMETVYLFVNQIQAILRNPNFKGYK